jgi:hypothetical protein
MLYEIEIQTWRVAGPSTVRKTQVVCAQGMRIAKEIAQDAYRQAKHEGLMCRVIRRDVSGRTVTIKPTK